MILLFSVLSSCVGCASCITACLSCRNVRYNALFFYIHISFVHTEEVILMNIYIYVTETVLSGVYVCECMYVCVYVCVCAGIEYVHMVCVYI